MAASRNDTVVSLAAPARVSDPLTELCGPATAVDRGRGHCRGSCCPRTAAGGSQRDAISPGSGTPSNAVGFSQLPPYDGAAQALMRDSVAACTGCPPGRCVRRSCGGGLRRTWSGSSAAGRGVRQWCRRRLDDEWVYPGRHLQRPSQRARAGGHDRTAARNATRTSNCSAGDEAARARRSHGAGFWATVYRNDPNAALLDAHRPELPEVGHAKAKPRDLPSATRLRRVARYDDKRCHRLPGSRPRNCSRSTTRRALDAPSGTKAREPRAAWPCERGEGASQSRLTNAGHRGQ